MQPDPVRLLRQMEAAERRASEIVAFDLPHHLKADSVAATLLAGLYPSGGALEAQQIRAPAGDWKADQPELGTLDLVPDGLVELSAVEVVTRFPHPEALSLSLDGGAGFAVAGALERFHGPGRDEVTWRWSGEQQVRGARVTLRRGEGALDVLASRLRGAAPTAAPSGLVPGAPVSPEEEQIRDASPAAPPPG